MERMTAVVTGGAGGIGTAICKRLAAKYQVIACYFKDGRHDEAKRWHMTLKEAGYDIEIVYADIANFSDCEKLTSLVMERFGRIDVLVNNAGITQDSSLKKMTPQQWQQVIDANLTSVFNMTRNVLPAMLEKNYGRIISISSVVGHMGNAGQTNYAAAKAGMSGFTKSLASEVGSRGITVNCVAPGFIDTDMTAELPETVKTKMLERIPAGRLGNVQEIAATVAFLASQNAAYITGETIHVNGGMYMA